MITITKQSDKIGLRETVTGPITDRTQRPYHVIRHSLTYDTFSTLQYSNTALSLNKLYKCIFDLLILNIKSIQQIEINDNKQIYKSTSYYDVFIKTQIELAESI